METTGRTRNNKVTDTHDSSDSDSEVILVDENKSKSVKRGNKLKKRNIKMTTTEEDHTQLLIEGGFDTEGMTEEEKQTLINVLLESKKDAFADESTKVETHCSHEEQENAQLNNNAECNSRGKLENEINIQPGTSGKFDTDYNRDTDYDSDKEISVKCTSKNFDTDYDRDTDYDSDKDTNTKRNENVHELDGDVPLPGDENKNDDGWLGKNRGGKANIDKKRCNVKQTNKRKTQDNNKKLKQRKMDQFSQILIPDEVENGQSNDGPVEKPVSHTPEERDISVPQTPEHDISHTAETSIPKKRHSVSEINDDDLTQPPESQDMFGFEQLIDRPVRGTESYSVEGENIQEKSNRKKAENKIKSVFDLETQPFDTDEVEVMDSSTQVDEEVDICTPVTPKKDDSLIAKQIDKGKLLFEKICTSASKLKGRLSRKRKAEDSCMDENVEKSGKKQHEMDREIEETSRVQKENKNIGTSKGVFQREVFEPCEPLCRKYRKRRRKSSPFISATGLKNVEVQIKAILQYFDIYHQKLKQAQGRIARTMEWGEPVRVGQHLDRTIDCKRRGYVYDFLDSDSENVHDNKLENDVGHVSGSTEKTNNSTTKNHENQQVINRKNTAFRFSDDDDDFENNNKLPDLKNLQTYNRLGRVTRSVKKPTYYEENQSSPDRDSEWIPIMEAETQNIQYSPDESKGKRQEKSKPSHTLTRRPLTRHASDLSNNSPVTSPVSSTRNCNTIRLESPSKISESSLDGLSQGSSLMLDDKGDLISTQVCVLKEKLPNLKVKPMVNKKITQPQPKSATDFTVDGTDSVVTSSVGFASFIDKTDNNLHENHENGKDAEKRKKKIPFTFNKGKKKASPDLKDSVNLVDSDSDDEISFKNVTSGTPISSSFSGYKTSSVFESVKNDKEMNRIESSHTTTSPTKRAFRFSRIKPPVESPVKPNRNINIDQDQEIVINDEPELRGDNSDTGTSDTRNSDSKSDLRVRRGRKRNHVEVSNSDVAVPVEKVEMMSCPLCLVRFPYNIIEDHASECDGTVQTKDEHDDQHVSYNGGSVNGSPTKKSTSSDTPRKLNSSGSSYTDEQDPDNQGEKIICYICDQSFTKGKSYDSHVDECIRRARMRQEEADMKGYNSWNNENVVVEKRSTRSRIKEESDGLLKKLDKSCEDNTAEGYTSDIEDEKQTLRSILRKSQSESSESESEYSGSDEYDYSPERPLPKPESRQHLPGGWSLEELANSPIKSFVPIWCQSDSDGFKNQFENSKRKYENKLIKNKLSGKRTNGKGRKRKRRRKTGRRRTKKAKTE